MGTENDINVDPIINDITNVLRISLDKLLKDFLNKNRVYEETYNHLIQLHTVIGRASGVLNDVELETRLLEKMNSVEEKVTETFEKLLRKIDTMQVEIDELKRDKVSSQSVPVSNECNITLVIEEKLGVGPDIIHGALLDSDDEEEEPVSSTEEEESETKESEEESEEEETEEEEESKEEEGSDEEEEYYEIEIKNVSYCTNDEVNGFIYELDAEGDIGKKVGYLKESQPFFY
jgi:hypothetical protein